MQGIQGQNDGFSFIFANAVGVNFLFLFPPSFSLLPLQFLSKVGLFIMSGLFHDPGADHHLSD